MSKLSKTRQRGFIIIKSRALVLFVSCIGGLISGIAVTYIFGYGFVGAPPLDIKSVGRIETLQMPVGARTLEDVSVFELRMDGADDFGRVFINNYLILDNESTSALFFRIDPKRSDANRKSVTDLVRIKNDTLTGARDAKPFLRKGTNYIVVENENSVLGTCELQFDLTVNNTRIKRFPQTMPNGFSQERVLINDQLAAAYSASIRDYKGNSDLQPSELEDALCARRVYEFNLD